jgi:RES domain-containing protein
VILFRIGSTGRTWPPEDLSGTGASIDPGRWNEKGDPVVYCSPTLAMAVLETAAHVRSNRLPLDRYVIEIRVPADVWVRRQITTLDLLSPGWDAVPAGLISVRHGTEWLASQASALLQVPSVIVPEEPIILINPRHLDASAITSRAIRKFTYSHLFR